MALHSTAWHSMALSAVTTKQGRYCSLINITLPEMYVNTQSIPRSKHTPSLVIKTNQLILYREIIAVCSQIHTEHINTLCGQNVELCMKLVVRIVTTGLKA